MTTLHPRQRKESDRTPNTLLLHWVTAILISCAAGSGAAALIYQVVWNRYFLTLFGSTTAATTAVVAAFMAGLAAGAAWFARRSENRKPPYLIYVLLELGIAIYALALPSLLAASNRLYPEIWQFAIEEPLLLNLVRLLLGIALLIVPTSAMGATLPILVRLLQPIARRAGRAAAWAYGFNAGGGAIGAAAAGWLLIPTFGLQFTYLLGAGISVAVAAAVALAAFLTPRSIIRSPASSPRAQALVTYSSRQSRILLPAALLLSGFAAMGFEIVWTRMLVLIMGSSTYAFTLLLVLYIAGIAAGSLWMGQRSDKLKSPALTFAHLQLTVALSAFAGLWLYGYYPELLLGWYRTWGTTFATTLAANAVLAALLIMLPAWLLGAAFPVAVRMHDSARRSAARAAGRNYGWMTLGNMAGVLATGGWLIAAVGLQRTFQWLIALTIASALILLVTVKQRVGRYATAAAAFSILLLIVSAPPQWNALSMTSGVYKEAPLYLELLGQDANLNRVLSSYDLLYYREGHQATVSVVQRPTLAHEPHLTLAIDGKVDASSGADMSTQVLSGHLPMLLHTGAKDVLVIGLASGVTAAAVARHTSVERIAVAEIEPAVVEAAALFSEFNHDVLEDSRLQLILDDGRHYLSVNDQRLDVIISEPSNPWMSGPARLFTREFFIDIQQHLRPGGQFVQWLPLYGLSLPLLQAEVRTYLDVFPHVTMFRVSVGDVLLIGSDKPASLDRLMQIPTGIDADLQRVNLSSNQLLSGFIATERGLSQWVNEGVRNTDDNGLLEFGAPRFLLVDTLTDNRAALAKIPWRKELVASLRTQGKADGWETIALAMAQAYYDNDVEGRSALLLDQLPSSRASALLRGDLAADEGNWLTAGYWWRQADGIQGKLRLADLSIDNNDPVAANRYLGRLAQEEWNDTAVYLSALASLMSQEYARADDLLALLSTDADAAAAQHIVAPYLRSIAQRRRSLAPRAADEAEFHRRLDRLRLKLERELGQDATVALLREVDRLGTSVLTESERGELQRAIQRRLIAPMSVYYQGVSELWTGQDGAAVTTLQQYLAQLPVNTQSSIAVELLRQARSKESGLLHALDTVPCYGSISCRRP